MPRFLLPPEAWTEDGLVVLTGDEARHCCQVLRVRIGDEIILFDGAGRSARATVSNVTSREVQARLGDVVSVQRPKPDLHLATAIPKGKTMDLVIQKATELGVDRITPLVTEHTVARPDKGGRDGDRKREKWQRVALEASKQCGRDWVPEVAGPTTLDELLAQRPIGSDDRVGIVADLPGRSQPLRELLKKSRLNPAEAVLLVGPEGDFSDLEYDQIRSAGYLSLDLGPLVLRCETASIAGLALLAHELRMASS